MHRLVEVLSRWRAHAGRAVLRNTLSLVFMAMAASQWAVLWWVLPDSVGALPGPVHVVAPLLLYGFNRHLAIRNQRRWRQRLPVTVWPRAYFAVTFTCLFCGAFLLINAVLWGSATALAGALVAEARIVQGAWAGESTLDMAFRWLGNAGLITIGLVFAYGYSIGQRRLKVRRVTVPLRHAPATMDGWRIAQISDIHIGQNLTAAELQRFVTLVNELEADLVCITGDIIDSPGADMDTFLPLLAHLRGRRGVVAILGNHDHHAGADRVEAALRRLTPFTVLRDARTTVDANGHPLHVIGLDDRGRDWARGVPASHYLETAVMSLAPNEPVLLLCHRPDIFPHAATLGVGLTLSGHTHGGQLAVPWFNGRTRNLAEFVTAYDCGLFESAGSYLYVNRGLGVTAQRIRLSTPREITLLEVRVRPALAQAPAAAA